MKYRPSDTLAHFNAAPQTHLHDLSDLPVSVLAAATKDYKKSCGITHPNDEATTFYTLNHAASIVRKSFTLNEPLPLWAQQIMERYTEVTIAQGERLLHYLLLITTREMRHLKSCTDVFWKDVEKKLGQASVDILKHISSNGGEDTAMNKYLETPPNMTIGQFVKTLSYGFHKAGGAGWSGGYGGKPWGDTTDALVNMIHGVTSLELLVDTGYTLAHNGGPIFDKGFLYGHHDANLLTVLDVQRSGQMLDLMFETQTLGIKKTPLAIEAAKLLKAHSPVVDGQPLFKGSIDWKLVDELRPQTLKDKFPAKYTKVIAEAKPVKTVKAKVVKAKPVAATFGATKAEETGQWAVYPGQTVTVYQRLEQ